MDDLLSLDPDLYHGLVYLKNYTGDVSDLSLTFAVDEDGKSQGSLKGFFAHVVQIWGSLEL